MSKKTKQLTEAQQRHLLKLNNEVMAARQRFEEFLAYLRDEHDASSIKWEITDAGVGFVRIVKPKKPDEPKIPQTL